MDTSMDDSRDRRTPEQVLADAEAYGVDLSLIRSGLGRSAGARLRELDEYLVFIHEARRSLARQLAAESSRT